jgi:hypothetical protein
MSENSERDLSSAKTGSVLSLKLYMWSIDLFAYAYSEDEAKLLIIEKVGGFSFIKQRLQYTKVEVIDTAKAFVTVGSTRAGSVPNLL